MLLPSCATWRKHAAPMLSLLGRTLRNCSPFADQLKDTCTYAHNAWMRAHTNIDTHKHTL